MEEFIDIILIAALILVIVFSGVVGYFLFTNPTIAYWLVAAFVGLLGAGGGFWIRKIIQKRRLGHYHELSIDLAQRYRAIQRALRKLDRPSRKILSAQFPKIRKLYEETQHCLAKVVDIDLALETLERQQNPTPKFGISRISPSSQTSQEKMRESDHRYSENIQIIQQSKSQHLQEIHEVIRCFDELNSQILALKYAPLSSNMGVTISTTLDELLIDLQALHEISA